MRSAYLALLFLLVSCSHKISETGKGSYYADKYNGRKTSNGDTFSQSRLTAAHKTLPFGTKVKVTNLDNGKTATVKINDRGPFVQGRIIDVSKIAAKKLDMLSAGVASVRITYKKIKS
ncbi:MAG: rare lipoprotein [Chitinophagaceae bacterium]|nr:rare lipoprotein [Chitinophagaceae bacterium]